MDSVANYHILKKISEVQGRQFQFLMSLESLKDMKHFTLNHLFLNLIIILIFQLQKHALINQDIQMMEFFYMIISRKKHYFLLDFQKMNSENLKDMALKEKNFH